VHAKYNSDNNQALIELFNGMTVDEKLNILSLNFAQIWYRVWLNTPRNATYYVAKNKFETTFMPDDGAKLRKLINKSSNSKLIWEIPKGRKRNKTEPDIQCAIREFTEETGVAKKNYKIFPSSRHTYSYIDAGTRYTNTYFVGLTRSDIEPRINFGLQDQIDEIGDIRWMSIEEIRFIDETGRLETFIKPIFKNVKKISK
jgi:8-oxo-dGTP pyrophosphatase MutT (NUDIX family)